MSRPPVAQRDTLAAIAQLEPCTNLQLMTLWDTTRSAVHERIVRLIATGHVVRTNPHKNPAIYRLTDRGRTAATCNTINPTCDRNTDAMVEVAIKTQPNSVFALAGGRVQLSIKEQP